MPMETLDIGREESRAARAWKALWGALPLVVRRGLVVLVASGLVVGVVATLARSDVHPARTAAVSHLHGRAGNALGPPPWAVHPRQHTEPAFELVNRAGRKVFVSTPPRFVFTIPAHRRLLFARTPVCTYQRFTAQFRGGPALGTIKDFCSANRWVILPTGRTRLR